MGRIYYKSNVFDYDEAEHKTILEILRDNMIYYDAPCGGNKTCGRCKIRIVYGNIVKGKEVQSISDEIVLACDCIPFGDIKVMPLIGNENYAVETDFKKTVLVNPGEHYSGIGVAIDIGTTTLVLYFYNLDNGEIIAIQTAVNLQKSYGADIMSRLKYYCSNKTLMNEIIIAQINDIIAKTASLYAFEPKDISRITIAGNTVMEHFFGGIDAEPIATAPYVPTSLFGIEQRAMNLGIKVSKNAVVYFAPCVSGFVGGDITAGMMSCNLDRTSDTILYLDIGTNGEIALAAKGRIFCCAAAAGPAFEGANISCGMGAQSGAISTVYLNEKNEIQYSTINDVEPLGICGSGLVDAVAVGIKLSIIDETGRIQKGNSLKIAEKAVLTQKDIREVQLAKSAICAGILTLMDFVGISFEQIDEVLLAGGFGTRINPKSACAIGLIPNELFEKIRTVGNAAGAGAAELLLKPEAEDRIQFLAEKCTYIELSENEFFKNEYITQMGF